MYRRSPLLAVVAVVVGLGACAARPLPPEKPTALLYRDLERLVTLTEAAGWGIDRLELEAMLPEVLDSVCRIERAHRAALLGWLDAEIAREGGSVEQVWRARGKKLSRVGSLLTMTRVRAALDQAMSAAEADCPFWLEPDGDFEGRQISDGQWQVSIGGGGKGIGVRQGGRDDINFGGGGRFLIGRVFDMRSALYTGFELGASASFPKDPGGERSSLVFGFDLVAPLIYRYTFVNTYLEGEAGWLGTSTEDDLGDITHGAHVGAAIGGRAARARWFFPGAALGVSWERTFPREEQGAARTTFKIGVRVVFDLDL
jgi:hypothetical protein